MFSLGSFTFLSPWVLAALAVVPVLWWLLRVLPPRPRTIKLSSFFLLKDLKTEVKTAAHTPWWLLLLRALILVFFILSLAEPVEKLSGGLPGHGGSVLVVIDNGWAAAAHWKERQDKTAEFLTRIRRDGRSIIFLPAAPSATEGKLRAYGPMDAGEAEKWIARLKPQPWPSDHKGLAEIADQTLKSHTVSYSVFLSDGLAYDGTPDLLTGLQRGGGGLDVVRDDDVNDPYVLKKTDTKPGDLAFRITRLVPRGQDTPLSLMAYAEEGGALDELKFNFPAREKRMDVTWDMLPDLRGKTGRIALRYPGMASAVFLTDSRWRQRPVGVVSDPARKESRSFLNEVYYLKRALEVNGPLAIDAPDALMKKTLSAIIWPDSAPMTAADRDALTDWVRAGGFLIRFAGPNLAANPDDSLLPVALRYGQRSMEGAMTWEKPVRLGGIPDESPLYGLSVPEDVTVTRQILADPVPESFEKTWLQLEDGTPLVTGGPIGKGVVVLVHTTAGPDWSNFCYSGLYVEALQRMVSLSTGIGDYKADILLQPLMLLDGFGGLQAPDGNGFNQPVDPAKDFTPSAQTPPGLYGDSRQFQVFNLGDSLPEMTKLDSIPAAAGEESYALSGEKNMKADFFFWALCLLLAETAATVLMRGVIPVPFRAAGLAFLLLLSPAAARAQAVDDADLASGIWLAYVETGDQDTDQVSYNGLNGLAQVLKLRTTINIVGVKSVDPATDKLQYYPFLYWPMTEAQHPLSASAARNLQRYMGEGGLIVFDTRDQQFGDTNSGTIGTRKLRDLTKNIQIPALTEVGEGHILRKSFYLLDDFPGRFDGGKVWAEKEPNQNYDAVTSVLIGGNDWAAAWSDDPRDRARFDIEPGGEHQREMAYRFGVNLTMMALAGNYKSDQVHVPYILERLRK